jgi:hypothetical protein
VTCTRATACALALCAAALAATARADGPPAHSASSRDQARGSASHDDGPTSHTAAPPAQPRGPAARNHEAQARAAAAEIASEARDTHTAAAEIADEAQETRPALRDPRSVFFIQRNKNRNEVHYGIRLDDGCAPLGDEPVYNYWLRLEEGPGVTKPVQLFQQAGYGIARQTVRAGAVEIVLRALDDRPVRVTASKREDGRCAVEAFLDIAGAPARFDKAFVFAEEGFLLPSVKYVELYGMREDGSPVRERIDVD